jgi:hypothetical protein
MTLPLSENQRHVDDLCRRLELGAPRGILCRVFGGFHHRMWRLETDRGTYAIKQLSPDTDLNDPDTVRHYNATETIGESFSRHGIGSIFALRRNHHYLQRVEDTGYLVYPWTDALALDQDCVSERHALEIARVLARMHRADIRVPDPGPGQLSSHREEQAITLVNQAIASNTPQSPALEKHLSSFLDILKCHRDAMPVLKKRLVISHGDLDQKNVLWIAAGEPLLIDWESARKLNPSYEILLEALDWSGITSQFAPALFEKMLWSYSQAGGHIDTDVLEAAFHCILGEWLNWLLYNIGRSVYLPDAEQSMLGAAQVDLTLAMLLRLQGLRPYLLASARTCAGITC